MTALRIALALAVVGVALAFAACGEASPAPASVTPTPTATPTSTATLTHSSAETLASCQGEACIRLVEWPSFEATYEYEGAVKRIQWADLDDWRVETLNADSIATPYGEFSAAGSWEEQRGSTYRSYDSITDVTSTETYESNAYIPPDGITPLLASLYEFPKRGNASKTPTSAEVCYLTKCTKQAEGLHMVERPNLDAVVTNDVWRIPLKNKGMTMLKLVINAEREIPQG